MYMQVTVMKIKSCHYRKHSPRRSWAPADEVVRLQGDSVLDLHGLAEEGEETYSQLFSAQSKSDVSTYWRWRAFCWLAIQRLYLWWSWTAWCIKHFIITISKYFIRNMRMLSRVKLSKMSFQSPVFGWYSSSYFLSVCNNFFLSFLQSCREQWFWLLSYNSTLLFAFHSLVKPDHQFVNKLYKHLVTSKVVVAKTYQLYSYLPAMQIEFSR